MPIEPWLGRLCHAVLSVMKCASLTGYVLDAGTIAIA
jgi:hypothetical protein